MGDSRKPSRRLGKWRGGSHLGSGRHHREARALGELVQVRMEAEAHHYLLRLGRREAGLLGSTEWAEHTIRLRAHGVAYTIQTLMAAVISGLEGSHTLEKISAIDIARDFRSGKPNERVEAPATPRNCNAKTAEQREEIRKRAICVFLRSALFGLPHRFPAA